MTQAIAEKEKIATHPRQEERSDHRNGVSEVILHQLEVRSRITPNTFALGALCERLTGQQSTPEVDDQILMPMIVKARWTADKTKCPACGGQLTTDQVCASPKGKWCR